MNGASIIVQVGGNNITVDIGQISVIPVASAVWGHITGNITDQTDLETALATKQNINYMQTAVRSVNSTTTMTITDGTIEVDTSGGPVTVNLLAISGLVVGRILSVPIIAGNNYVTIQPHAGDTIAGLSNILFNTPAGVIGNSSIDIMNDGTEWIII